MEWYSWLCKSTLDPVLVYEYSLLFSNNELEEDDIPHFNHDFLLSMGISIAKHRLEILKLAKKHNRYSNSSSPRPVSRLLAAIHRAKKSIAKYISSSFGRRFAIDNSAIVVVPRPPTSYYGAAAPRESTMLKRKKRKQQLTKTKQGRVLLLTDGAKVADSPIKVVGGGGKWGSGAAAEEISWDSLFQNLKPT
ncbi:hypothetical protein Cni_G24267 [Canna indica]|uniref:SAM domain-containing protein n=1 Tax=Canna indica TaxID=4628 RepID=A0AAQ3QJX9_9LILI|nr:hypothetical protein Cni_G24267 [Canna indica]